MGIRGEKLSKSDKDLLEKLVLIDTVRSKEIQMAIIDSYNLLNYARRDARIYVETAN